MRFNICVLFRPQAGRCKPMSVFTATCLDETVSSSVAAVKGQGYEASIMFRIVTIYCGLNHKIVSKALTLTSHIYVLHALCVQCNLMISGVRVGVAVCV
jgi:hypothetical protein